MIPTDLAAERTRVLELADNATRGIWHARYSGTDRGKVVAFLGHGATLVIAQGMYEGDAKLLSKAKDTARRYADVLAELERVRAVLDGQTTALLPVEVSALDATLIPTKAVEQAALTAEEYLRQMCSRGIVRSFQRVPPSPTALVYSVEMGGAAWHSTRRRELHTFALLLQEEHDLVVFFELRRPVKESSRE